MYTQKSGFPTAWQVWENLEKYSILASYIGATFTNTLTCSQKLTMGGVHLWVCELAGEVVLYMIDR